MKIAYWVNWDVASGDGVTASILKRVDSWRNQGHEVRIFALTRGNHETIDFEGEFVSKGKHKKQSVYELASRCIEFAPDICNQRFEFYSKSLEKLYQNIPTVIELHTLYRREFQLQARLRPKSWLHRYLWYEFTHRKQNRSVAGFVGVTQEILNQYPSEIHENNSVVIPNAANHLLSVENPTQVDVRKPKIVFVGSAGCPWHGVDRLMKLAESTGDKLDFHIIGPLSENMIQLPNVTFHGPVYGEEYLELLSTFDIGIAPLAFDRNSMREACPLKVRDYAKVGMPMAIRHIDPAFGDDNPSWVFSFQLDYDFDGKADEIDQFVQFCRRWQGQRIALTEREQYFSIDVIEKRRLDFFERIIS